MLIYTKDQLSKLTVSELKSICKSNQNKGFSQLKKADLIQFTYNNQPSSFSTPIQYIFNDALQMYSITNLDYINLSIKEMTNLLKEHAAGKMFSNQAMNEKEVKALYRAGFRMRHNETLSENETLAIFNEIHSIQMVANTTKFNIIEVVEVPEVTTKIETEEIENNSIEQSFTVGQRSFNSHDAAVKYCNENDFDIEIMIIPENKDITPNNNNVYWYEYTLRGFSLGCQPKGFIEHNDYIGRHGIVAYNRRLTDNELSSYELIPYNEAV